ncbi:MAG: hypothetical protein ABL984_02465 [Pyrinomonadaceae bacterium]
MERNETANLLSIFSFIFAGIQGLALLLIGLYALIMAFVLVSSAVSGSNAGAEAYIVPGVIALVFTLMGAIGLTNVILNIRLGRALRSANPPSPKRVIVTSIFNICSFFCGGVFILPFGMALGIFGIVFASSEKGKAYLNGIPSGLILAPPPPVAYSDASSGGHIWR